MASSVTGYLERLLDGARRRAGIVFVAAALAAAGGAVLLTRVSFDANVLGLLPRRSPPVRSFQTFLRDFGSLDHLYVVFESADAIGDHSDLVDAYVEELRKAPEIASVDVQLFEPGKDWGYLYDRELYLLGPAAADALARLRPPALDHEIAHARDLLSVPSSDVKAYVQQDPVGLVGLLRDRLGRQNGFTAFDPTQEGYVSADGRSRLVIVKPAGAPFDTDFCKRLFRRLDDVERAARAASSGEDSDAVKILAAGAYRVSLEAESLIRSDGIVNTIGSLVLLLVIVLLIFRTPWMMLYSGLPLALASVLALGITGAIRGSLSPATSGSAGMLFGLGLDGVVLLYMRYLGERDSGHPLAEACRRMAGTASAVVLAQVTTAATFLAMLLIDFPTLQELGAIVGVGILLACGFTLVILPALLSRNRSTRHSRALTTPWLGRFVIHRSGAIVATAVVATVVLGAAASRLHVDMGLERLQARTRGSQLQQEIFKRFSLPTDVLLVLNQNEQIEPLLAADARISAELAPHDPEIGVAGIGLMLPPAAVQQAVSGQITAAGALTAGETASAIRAAAAHAGFRPDALDPFLQRLPRLLDPEARITYDGLIGHGLGSIVSRFVVRRNGRYTAVTYLYPRHTVDFEGLASTLRGIDPRLQLTGLPAIDHDLAQRFPRQFLKGIALGTLFVALLIQAVLRNLRHTLLALVPTVAGFAWSAGLLALAGIEVDLFSMFAAVTCIGIAVDYGIYVLHRYANEAEGDVEEVLTRTGAAIIIACLTALVGFGSLVNSSYGPLRVFGLVSVVTLICCLVASLLLLPALLVRVDR